MRIPLFPTSAGNRGEDTSRRRWQQAPLSSPSLAKGNYPADEVCTRPCNNTATPVIFGKALALFPIAQALVLAIVSTFYVCLWRVGANGWLGMATGAKCLFGHFCPWVVGRQKGKEKKMKRMKIIATCKRMKIIATCHLSITLFYLRKKYGGFLNDSSPCQL